jgi:hypothetical protein
MIRIPVLFLLLLAQSALGVPGQMQPPAAPPGLHVELRTAADRHTFHLSEIVPLEIVFQSSRPATYSLELADGWNSAPGQDRMLVQPGETVIRRLEGYGIVCCASHRAALTATPAVYAYDLTDLVRFTEPGEYQVQYSSRRVFAGPPTPGDAGASDLVVRSNVITLTVVDDEAGWTGRALRAALDVLPDGPFDRFTLGVATLLASFHRGPLSKSLVTSLTAYRQLRQLDTPLAIHERVWRLRMPESVPISEARRSRVPPSPLSLQPRPEDERRAVERERHDQRGRTSRR